ncbi:MAG TPA: dihydrolipoyl dehydrogenase [Anaerolineales bacterium]|jgi:dihydrolipoamide dehydrogenase
MADYDVIVVGAGPGGYVGAIRAAQLGQKTAIVDRQWLGGVCLNVGCIPSKALLDSAQLVHKVRERADEYGLSFDNLKIDYSAAVKRSREASDRLTKGVGFLMKKNEIDVHMGNASFTGPKQLEVTDDEGKKQTLKAANIIIATGAKAALISGVEIDGQQVVTYLEAILQEKLPKSAVVVGGGPIGLEFATLWNAYGVEVTIVEMLPSLAPNEDEEVGKEIAKAFRSRGMTVLTGHKVESVEVLKTKVKVNVSDGDEQKTVEGEQVLIAIGWKPNTADLGLDKAGVRTDDRGFVEIDDRMATNVEGVWAIGDVTGKLPLAHVASAMGIVCAENIAGVETTTLDYEMMPRATYSMPQIASFGLTEVQARERGFEVEVNRFPFQVNGKALGMGEKTGWVKLINDSRYGEILGAHMVGPEVTELLPELTIAQMMELTPAEIARNVHAHPTLSEALMEVAHMAEGHPIHL